MDIKQTFIFYALLPCVHFPFLWQVKFCGGYFRQFFFHLGDKKVVAGHIRQADISCNSNGIGISLGGLSTGHLRQVVIL